MATQSHRDIHVEARNKWPSILTACGIDESFLRDRHGPCPACGGKDRFRFDDRDGKGTYFCSSCGAGSGLDLLMIVKGINFSDAAALVRQKLPMSFVQTDKRKASNDVSIGVTRIWQEAKALKFDDESSRYLIGRGFGFNEFKSTALRTHPGLKYRIDEKTVTGQFPAMIAAVNDAKGKLVAVHRTYVSKGRKADVALPKKTLGKLDASCAIRIHPATDVLGVAEGIETAIAAHRIFKVPFWALISAGQMHRFIWPDSIKRLIICGDNDLKFAGQCAAYALGHRAAMKGIEAEVLLPTNAGTDYADTEW